MVETPLSSSSVQHFIEIPINPNRYKLIRFHPRNSVLKSFFMEKLGFFDTY